jgi:integrase
MKNTSTAHPSGTPRTPRDRRATSSQRTRPAAKRANRQGAIYPRRNQHGKIISYRGQVTIGWKNGRQVRQSFTAKTKEAVREMMNRTLVRQHDGLMPDTNGLTVAAYLEEWLKHKASEVRPSTLEGYKSIIEWHLKPILGRLRLDGLQPKHVDHLHKTLQEKKLAHRTLEYAHVVLHGALAYAVRLEMLPRNVADAVKVPRRRGRERKCGSGRLSRPLNSSITLENTASTLCSTRRSLRA